MRQVQRGRLFSSFFFGNVFPTPCLRYFSLSTPYTLPHCRWVSTRKETATCSRSMAIERSIPFLQQAYYRSKPLFYLSGDCHMYGSPSGGELQNNREPFTDITKVIADRIRSRVQRQPRR